MVKKCTLRSGKQYMNQVKISINNKDKENIRKYQTKITELKNIITELKYTPNGFINRPDQIEERIKGLQNRAVEFIQSKRNKRKKNSKDSLWDFHE